jgi:hypothetical protein
MTADFIPVSQWLVAAKGELQGKRNALEKSSVGADDVLQ